MSTTNTTNHPMSKYEYQVGGSLPPDFSSYIQRQADEDFYHALKKGDFCYVLTARQMGKSSLRRRTIQRLRAEGFVCANIDITEMGYTNTTQEQCFAGIIDMIAEMIALTDFDLDTWWESHRLLSPVHHLKKFFEEILLVQVQQPIVIFVDEIDAIYQFGKDFFALIRRCYNMRTDKPAYRRLTFAIFGGGSPTDLFADKKSIPFSIGHAIHLTCFEFHEAASLAQGLAVPNPKAVLQIILDWTSGQPFLTQKLCQLISQDNTPIPEGEETNWIEQWIQNNIINHWETQDEPIHLRTIRDRILHEGGQQTGRLLGLYQKLLQRGELPADDSREQVILRFSGLVVLCDNKLLIYNKIYKKIFNLAWVEKALAGLRPYAESFQAWVASGYQDKSRLLQGQALQEAQAWAKDNSISDADRQFLAASDREQALTVQIVESITKQRDIVLEAIGKGTYECVNQLVQIPHTQEIATEILNNNSALLDKVYDLYPNVREAAREKAANLGFIGNSWLLLGNIENALQAYQQSLKIRKILPGNDPTSFPQRDLSIGFNKIGDVQLQQGNTEKALQTYQQSLAIRKKLVKENPTSFQALRDLGISLDKIGNVQLPLGNTKKALQAYEQSLDISKKLAKSNPTSFQAQRDLTVCFNKIGDVELQLGETERALQAYQQDLEISQKLAKDDPTNFQAKSDLGISYSRLGSVQLQLGNAEAALTAYQEYLRIKQQLVQDDPNNAKAQRGLAVSFNKIGDVQLLLDNPETALDAYQQSLAISQKLAQDDPNSYQAQHDLLVSYYKLGTIQASLQKTVLALQYYQQALAIAKELAAKDPLNRTAQNNLIVLRNLISELVSPLQY